jgi:hypothetical protein
MVDGNTVRGRGRPSLIENEPDPIGALNDAEELMAVLFGFHESFIDLTAGIINEPARQTAYTVGKEMRQLERWVEKYRDYILSKTNPDLVRGRNKRQGIKKSVDARREMTRRMEYDPRKRLSRQDTAEYFVTSVWPLYEVTGTMIEKLIKEHTTGQHGHMMRRYYEDMLRPLNNLHDYLASAG